MIDYLDDPNQQTRKTFYEWIKFRLNMMNEALDGTGSFYRRSGDRDRVSDSPGGIRIPPGVVVGLIMYLVANTVGGIWWAATMQAKIDSLTTDNVKLWQKIETQELLQNRLENNLDERIRGKIRETANDWGLFVSRKGN